MDIGICLAHSKLLHIFFIVEGGVDDNFHFGADFVGLLHLLNKSGCPYSIHDRHVAVHEHKFVLVFAELGIVCVRLNFLYSHLAIVDLINYQIFQGGK